VAPRLQEQLRRYGLAGRVAAPQMSAAAHYLQNRQILGGLGVQEPEQGGCIVQEVRRAQSSYPNVSPHVCVSAGGGGRTTVTHGQLVCI
jgi:hypothetical protein